MLWTYNEMLNHTVGTCMYFTKLFFVEMVMIIKTRHWVWHILYETIGQCLGVMSSGVETPGNSSNEKRLEHK